MKKPVVFILHIGYWLMYLLLILFFLHFPPLSYKARSPASWLHLLLASPLGISVFLPAALGFYSFYTILFVRFLKRKRIVALFLSGLGVALVCGLFSQLVLYLFYVPRSFTKDHWSADTILVIAGSLSFLALVHGLVGLVLKGFITSYGDIQLKEDLNRKNYETELALVKAQINPHFLFNTLNNIDVLIEKDAKQASLYLNKLSDIMRFMLYETKTEKISLTKELIYIEKYIDLQRIRSFNPDYVSYAVAGSPGNLIVEPMLFIPFIENAFKHTENKKMANAIRVRFVIEGNSINFNCENHYSEAAPGAGSGSVNRDGSASAGPDHGGLGNELIRKRLMLLYPGKHTLTISNENKTYTAILVLSL